MAASFRILIDSIPNQEPSRQIAERVMRRIAERELTRIRFKVGLVSVVTIGAIASFVPAVAGLVRGFASSGLNEYLSLMFSDGASLASHWGDVSYSIASSWPVVSSAAICALLIVLTFSIRRLGSYASSLSSYRLRLS